MQGKRRYLVTLQTMTEGTPDSFGEPARSYTKLGDAWAQMTPVRSTEQTLPTQVDSTITYEFNIGWASEFAGLGAKDRVIYGSRVFDIASVVDPSGRNRELVITADERSQ